MERIKDTVQSIYYLGMLNELLNYMILKAGKVEW